MKARMIGAGLLLGALVLLATLVWRESPRPEQASRSATAAGGGATAEPVGLGALGEVIRSPAERSARREVPPRADAERGLGGFGLRVVEARAGGPVAGASAFATEGPRVWGQTGLLGTAGADGWIEVLELEADTWILVTADGFASRRVAPPEGSDRVVTVELERGFDLEVFVRTSSGSAAPAGSLVMVWEGATPPTALHMAVLPQRAGGASPLRTGWTTEGGRTRLTGLAFGADYMLKAVSPGEVQVGFQVVDTSALAGGVVELETSRLLIGAIAPPEHEPRPTRSDLQTTGMVPGVRTVLPDRIHGTPPLSAPAQDRFFHQSPHFAQLAVDLLKSPSTQALLDSAAFLLFRHQRDPRDESVSAAEISVLGRAAERPLELVPAAQLSSLTPFESVFGQEPWRRHRVRIDSPVRGRLAAHGGLRVTGSGSGGTAEWTLNDIQLGESFDLLAPGWVETLVVAACAWRGDPLHEFDREALAGGHDLVVSNFALLALRLPSTPLDHLAVGRFELYLFATSDSGGLFTHGTLGLGAGRSPTQDLIALPARDDLRLLPPEHAVIEAFDYYRAAIPDLALDQVLTPPLPLEIGKVTELTIDVVE